MIEDCNKIHNFRYDYSKLDSLRLSDYQIISCPIHGDFRQRLSKHLEGQGCKECGKLKSIGNRRAGIDSFISKANKVHNNFYDYSKSIYINSITPLEIICPVHGSFWQRPDCHTNRGHKCPKCSIKLSRDTLKVFIAKSNEVHNYIYDYDKTEYTNSRTKVIVTCSEHGDFKVKPCEHINNKTGCPECGKVFQVSKKEKELGKYLEGIGLEVIYSYRPDFLNGKEIDIYIPKYKLGIEYNGTLYHHSTKNVSSYLKKSIKDSRYHLIKFNSCFKNEINLLHIFEFESFEEWKNNIYQYIQNPNDFKIIFKNNRRQIKYSNELLDFYGESFIVPITSVL